MSVKTFLSRLFKTKQIPLETPPEPVEYEPGTDLNQHYDLQTAKVMKRCLGANSNCIDIGCHEGAILRQILTLAPLGQHFAFEPLPEFFAHLQTRFSSVSLHQIALSDSKGVSVFQQVVSNPGYSGLLKRRYDRPDETVEQIEVQTDRLDNVLPEDYRLDFIKADVEGAEYLVFCGALETIKRCRPVIVFEFGLGAADYYGVTAASMYQLLVNECNLSVSLMSSWLAGQSPLTEAEFEDQFKRCANYYFIAYPE